MKTPAAILFSVSLVFVLTACLPVSPEQPQPSEQTADIQATALMLAETIAAQTLESLPTPTLVPPTETPTPEPVILAESETPTADPLDILTSLPTITATSTSTVIPKSGGQPWTCDTIPDFVERGKLVIGNSTNKTIYISLFGISRPHEYHVCYGFDLRHGTSLDIPLGSYTYVVVVGGAKHSGVFNYYSAEQKVSMTVYKDRVAIH